MSATVIAVQLEMAAEMTAYDDYLREHKPALVNLRSPGQLAADYADYRRYRMAMEISTVVRRQSFVDFWARAAERGEEGS